MDGSGWGNKENCFFRCSIIQLFRIQEEKTHHSPMPVKWDLINKYSQLLIHQIFQFNYNHFN